MAGESALSFYIYSYSKNFQIFNRISGRMARCSMIAGLMNNAAVDIKQSVNGGYVSNNKTIVKWLSPHLFCCSFYFTYKKA